MKKYFRYGILMFIFSIIIGYMYSRMWNNNKIAKEKIVYQSDLIQNVYTNNNVISNEQILQTISEEEKVSPTTKFAIKKYYNKCGHFSFDYVQLPIEIINLKKEEVANVFKDWNIEKFSKDEVVISQNIDEMCKEHFVIKLDNDFIKIYNKVSDDTLNLYLETDIYKQYLADEDIKRLENGISVYGKGKLNSILEDFE